ncbi:toll/interleukin-1 receptor domain-containing protein [candidate division KSB1 bacterium]|nr:toll/interleukin-1 receptor domain-containing protein [candidate division KSB1 bacterium]
MSTHFDYDVFISHSTKDKPVARELANRLKKDGLRVWLDEWEIQPGDMIGLKIQRGLERSRIPPRRDS